MELRILLISLCTLCALTTTNPLYGRDKRNSNNQLQFNSHFCFLYGDSKLITYIELRCSFKYRAQPNCLEVVSCPNVAPTLDEQMMKAWLAWKMYNTSSDSQPNNTTPKTVAVVRTVLVNGSNDNNPSGSGVPYIITQDEPNSTGGTTQAPTTTTSTSTTSTTTTTTTTTTTSAPQQTTARNSQSTPCLRYRRTAIQLYKSMGCAIRYGLGCSMVYNCPTECHDSAGRVHKLSSGSWFEGKQTCSCDNIRHVRTFVPRTPRRGTPWPPYKNCVMYGCFVPMTYEYISPGESITLYNGRQCSCKHGRDPEVQDDAPPFHLSCPPIR